MGWTADLPALLDQPLLARDLLSDDEVASLRSMVDSQDEVARIAAD